MFQERDDAPTKHEVIEKGLKTKDKKHEEKGTLNIAPYFLGI